MSRLIVVMLLLAALMLMFHRNSDASSPTKILLGFFTLVFFGAFIKEAHTNVYIIYALLVAALICASWNEVNRVERKAGTSRNSLSIEFKLWILTSIPILAFLYMLISSGGWSGYINNMYARTKTFEGLGLLLVAIKSITSINSVYFVYRLQSTRRGVMPWIFFGVHLIVTSAIALATGSRNTVLAGFLIMLMAIPVYTRIRIGPVKSGFVFAGLLVSLIVLEFIRNAGTDALLILSDVNSEDYFSAQTFAYAVTPIENVSERLPNFLMHGKTFLAAITVFIPRALWPTKPPGGADIYTYFYYGDIFKGYSALSPGIFAESAMNFGLVSGFFVGFVIVLCGILATRRMYRTIISSAEVRPEKFLMYAFLVIFVANLPFAEFATGVTNFVTRGILAVIIARLVRLRLINRVRR